MKTNTIEDAFRGAAGPIEHLVRAIVRDELRRHLGPEADHLINVKSGAMSAVKLRRLVRSGELRGFSHGRDTFISASEFRALIERKPVPPPPPPMDAPEPPEDPDQDGVDDVLVRIGYIPPDPAEHAAFEGRLALRRAAGGGRATALREAELERDRRAEKQKRHEERRTRSTAKKRGRTR